MSKWQTSHNYKDEKYHENSVTDTSKKWPNVSSWKNKALEKLCFSGDFCNEALGLLSGVEVRKFMVILCLSQFVENRRR